MAQEREANTAEGQIGRCWGCGYMLRGLPVNVCPECGRGFDPADRRSMNMGRAMGRFGRMLCRPAGWWVVLLALGATGVIGLCSRWPVGGVEWSVEDLRYYWGELEWCRRVRSRPGMGLVTACWEGLKPMDRAYLCALAVWACVIALWLVRLVIRFIAVRLYRQPRDLRQRGWRRHVALATLALASAAMVGASWPWRIAQSEGGAFYRPISISSHSYQPLRFPAPLDRAKRKVLLASLVQLPNPRDRMKVLVFIAEANPDDELYLLLQAAPHEKDPAIRSRELHLIGIYRDASTVPMLLSDLNHSDATVRAAAADALGMIHCPAYDIPSTNTEVRTSADPMVAGEWPIDFRYIGTNWRTGEGIGFIDPGSPPEKVSTIPLPAAVRDALENMMLRGATTLEREAAARALVAWPPEHYQLRVAEWGVWIADETGDLRLAQSVIDEIPPFVHQVGDTRQRLQDCIIPVVDVSKPIIHLTADRPLAIDVQARIRWGRTWFAYPRPDDLSFEVQQLGRGSETYRYNQGRRRIPLLEPLDNARLSALDDPVRGYPWVSIPPRPRYGSTHGFTGGMNDIAALGVRWQSLIISPEKLPWMTPVAVPGDEKFAWWSRLREAPCSWVSSRDESERFVYYDGPTLLKSPLAVTMDWRGLRCCPTDYPNCPELQSLPRGAPHWGTKAPTYQALYIEVAGGKLRGWPVELPEAESRLDLPIKPPLEGDAVAGQFLAMLTARGLTESEASALIDCWRGQLFQTAGRRVLMFLRRGEYDARCPLYMRPAPTKVVRVGMVLTEL